jgi:hypothetical protein
MVGLSPTPTKTICISSKAGLAAEPKEIRNALIEQCLRHDIPPVVSTSSPAGGSTL